MTRLVTTPWGAFRGFDQDLVSHILTTGVFWDQQIQPFLDEGDPQGWALDLGANIGWFTVYLARRYMHVLAVEAHPTTFRLLEENVRANGLEEKVTCLHVAAYDKATQLKLAPGAWHGWPIADDLDLDQVPNAASLAFIPATAVEAWVQWGSALSVPALPLDEIMALGQHRVTLIKVDCQGCDLRALVGLQQTIAQDRPLIVFEFEQGASAWHGDTWADYEQFFAARDYSVTRIREDLWDYVARPGKGGV